MIHEPSVKNWDGDVRKAAEELDKRFPRRDYTSTYPGHGEYSAVGAYAIDFMCDRAMGDKIAAYVWKNRKRLGVRYVIWYGRIISETSNTPNRWVRYFNADNPNPSKSHKNHVHVSFYKNPVYHAPVSTKPVTMYVKPGGIKGYKIKNGAGVQSKVREEGYKIVGKIKSRSDGKYLVTAFGNWYPLDGLTKTAPTKIETPPVENKT